MTDRFDDTPPSPRTPPDPPLPAWMTLPGSLATPSDQPSPPEGPPETENSPAADALASPEAVSPELASPEVVSQETVSQEVMSQEVVSPEVVPSEAASPGGVSPEVVPSEAVGESPGEGVSAEVPSSDLRTGPVGSEGGSFGDPLSGAGAAGRGTARAGAERASGEPGVVANGSGENGVHTQDRAPRTTGKTGTPVPEDTDHLDPAGDPQDTGDSEEPGPKLGAALEAILMVVDEPVAEVTLAQVLERPTHEVAAGLRALAAEYTGAGRGFDLREVAGGWRFYTRADCAPLVERFVRDGQQTRLTQAALETLAVVAYRQPVSRARVAAVRGVNSDGVMRTLVARGLVEEAGTDPESQAVLYRTSSYFLERLGLKEIGELPELAPFLPDDVENLEETTK